MSEILKAMKENVIFPTMRKFGQITIDADIRKKFDLKEGDEVCIVVIPMSTLMSEFSAEEVLQLRHPDMVASS